MGKGSYCLCELVRQLPTSGVIIQSTHCGLFEIDTFPKTRSLDPNLNLDLNFFRLFSFHFLPFFFIFIQ
jgi:hypothetical protein